MERGSWRPAEAGWTSLDSASRAAMYLRLHGAVGLKEPAASRTEVACNACSGRVIDSMFGPYRVELNQVTTV
jgi:hypothetical protein